MADKDFQMMQRNATNTAWDNLFPKTKAANVTASDSTTMEAHHTNNSRHITTADQDKTGKWTVTKDTSTATPLPTDLYSKGQVEVRTNTTGPASIGFHRVGNTGAALFHMGNDKVNVFRVKLSDGQEYAMLHEGWLGHGNGINADKVDNIEGSQIVRNDIDQGMNQKLIVRGNSGRTGEGPVITLALGDGDTGLNWSADGNIQFVSNNTVVAQYHGTAFDFKIAPSVNGNYLQTKKIIDDTTGTGYQLGINNGLLYYKQV